MSEMVASELSVNKFLLSVDTACASAVRLPLDYSRIFGARVLFGRREPSSPVSRSQAYLGSCGPAGAGAEGFFIHGGLVMDHSQQWGNDDSARLRALTGQTVAFGGSSYGAH